MRNAILRVNFGERWGRRIWRWRLDSSGVTICRDGRLTLENIMNIWFVRSLAQCGGRIERCLKCWSVSGVGAAMGQNRAVAVLFDLATLVLFGLLGRCI